MWVGLDAKQPFKKRKERNTKAMLCVIILFFATGINVVQILTFQDCDVDIKQLEFMK